ncbi:hypothetical protein CTI12_AA262000 [Artemisia annua]|uniref:Uncharacterized protein n=1 Tax=Artemisia annua TaxID=35608 RepID=A0A2U1NIJ5_ARTAN|nr:hypothetical protein CTI12_AA262000 [Artemisia annua]
MLERQIMFKQLQELQRKKRLQELNDGKQKIIDQISLTRNKSSSGAQPGLLNNGITVRDPSQMFKFGDTNLVQGQNQVLQSVGLASASLLTKDESQQAGTFSKSFNDGQFKASSSRDAVNLDPLKHKKLFSAEGNSWGTINFEKTDKSSELASVQSGSLSALMHSAAAEASSSDSRLPYYGLRFSPSSERPHVNNFDSASSPYFGSQSPIVSVEKVVGQQFSTFEAKPHFMTSGVTQGAASSTHLPNTWVDVPEQLNFSGMGSCEPSIRASIKNGSVNYDNKISQGTSLSHLKPAHGSYINFSISSQPRQDKAPSSLKNQKASKTEYDATDGNSSLVQVASTGQSGSVGPITKTDKAAVLKSKKRKFGIFECLPWHREVTKGYSRLHNIISCTEWEWARSVGRLSEMLKDEEVAGSLWTVRRKRRLSLTTQLMQLLFRPAPAVVLSEDATAHCDTVIFYAAKLPLGDACSLCSASGKNMTSKSSRDQDLSKTVQQFIDRRKRLEDELSRLEKGELSILELSMDFQDLEKFSMVNRFAKRHIRGPMITDTSSGVATALPKLRPQKYVKTSKMPKTIPDGQNCLSL